MSANLRCVEGIQSPAERLAVELSLMALLHSDQFRNARRSSDFLRYVVEQTLQGRGEELKERTIGIAVFGKQEDYDTAADALVRVRANDVRRRLAQYYDATLPKHGVRIELRAGSYVPVFVSLQTAVVEQVETTSATVSLQEAAEAPMSSVPRLMPPAMALWQMAAPTAIALFLAIVAIRFDVQSDDAYSRFWSHMLARRNSICITMDEGRGAGWISQDLASSALPFSEVAREWQVPIVFGSGKSAGTGDDLRIDLKMAPQLPSAEVVVGSLGEPTLTIEGPTIPAIQAAVTRLCSRRQFLMSEPFAFTR